MDSKNISKKDEGELNSKIYFDKLKGDYFLQKVFENLKRNRLLAIIKCNKKIKNRLNINIKDYKEYSEIYSSIELEIIPIKNKYGKFININNDESYYHIYFNDGKEEIKKYSINENDKISKIKIIIDYQIKSFEKLLYDCECIESINFKKFHRNNIINMRSMFFGCSSLKELNLNNFNTNNVTDMSYMFYGCSSLKELNLNNFNTNKVIYMSYMFRLCSSLKELNLNNFNTNNVTDMCFMFSDCSSLKELNISNFNTNKVTNMSFMFSYCSSLKELNISNFNYNSIHIMTGMFDSCSNQLKFKTQN